MKKKIIVLFIVGAFLLSAIGAAFADTHADATAKKQAQATALASKLPISDGVLTFDAKRLITEALPQILSGNPQMLGDLTSKIDALKNKIGIDVRQFEQVAIGFNLKTGAGGKSTVEPVILTRGSFNAPALLAVGKIAANGKYREEKIGDKTIYIFSIADSIKKDKTAGGKGSFFEQMLNKIFDGLNKEIAVAAFDNNTLTFGTLARVRETFTGKARISSETLSLVDKKANAIMSFGAKFPNGLAQIVNLENDELGANLDGIRQLSGFMEVAGANTILEVTAKTDKSEQASALQSTLVGLQSVFTNILLGSKSDDNKVYGRLLKNAKFSQTGSDITLNVQVPQTDIDVLIGKIK